MDHFSKHIEKTYKLPLSVLDRDSLNQSSSEQQIFLKKRIERKYQICAEILKSIQIPSVKKTLKQLLQRPPQVALRAFNRIQELLKLKEAAYLDNDLFEKYHRKVINRSQVHSELLRLVNRAKDEAFTPQEFQEYLKSGLFDQGVYTLHRGPSQEELQETVEAMRKEIQEKYQLTLSARDEMFLLNNKVRNQHIINQIVVPKYRLVYEIKALLGNDYMPSVLQTQLEYGLNEKVPILKRIKALAKWYHEGFLSQILVKKLYYTLVNDLDELEDFFLFLEKISEFISKDRAIHYMELGFYECFEEEIFEELLQVEKILYDVHDDIQGNVREFIQVMKTPAASKSLITNRRLAECFSKFAHAVDLLIEHADLLAIQPYLPKLQQFHQGFISLHLEYEGKNPSLPAKKPYRAIEFIRPCSKMYFIIESENLLRMSQIVAEKSEPLFQESIQNNASLSEALEQFQKRLKLLQAATTRSQDLTEVMGQLLPLEQSYIVELEHYLNPSASR